MNMALELYDPQVIIIQRMRFKNWDLKAEEKGTASTSSRIYTGIYAQYIAGCLRHIGN